jgi:phage terminase large subunit-like protein
MIIAEKNFGGAMVSHTIRSVAPHVPIRMVNASRGKHVRAEPIAALYERGLVRHLGYFRELEEQMQGMTHNGYEGIGSPDRVDSLVWALHELSAPRSTIGVIHGARY